ncbi:hypothetical protein GX586_14310, partial [bacterium]|nr:hypothetical protein [bacterium]
MMHARNHACDAPPRGRTRGRASVRPARRARYGAAVFAAVAFAAGAFATGAGALSNETAEEIPWESGARRGIAPTQADIAEFTAATSVWYRVRTSQFTVLTHNRALSARVLEAAEAALTNTQRSLGISAATKGPVELLVFRDLAESAPRQRGFRTTFPLPRWHDARLVGTHQLDETGMFRTAVLLDDIPSQVAHVVLDAYFGGTDAPFALREGLARTFEASLASNLAGFAAAGAAGESWVAGARLFALGDDAIEDDALYHDVWNTGAAWGMFLREKLPPARMGALLARLRNGDPIAQVLADAFDHPPEDVLARMDEELRDWVLMTFKPPEQKPVVDLKKQGIT